jgi:uncharacterized protein (DUF427 family)
VRVETGQKRVRAYLAGQLVADTIAPVLVWEHDYYPQYYFADEHVRAELVPTGQQAHFPSRGPAEVLDVRVDGVVASGAAIRYDNPEVPELSGLVKLRWDAMDVWLEEDEPIQVHPRDPYKRVDVLGSSRHVEVYLDGVKVADSTQPRILFETGLPPRYYLPLSDVQMQLLRSSETTSRCPYKGTASYWSLEVNGRRHDDLVWTYPAPLPESHKVAGLVCFYNEKVDLVIDGVPQERPKTHFS